MTFAAHTKHVLWAKTCVKKTPFLIGKACFWSNLPKIQPNSAPWHKYVCHAWSRNFSKMSWSRHSHHNHPESAVFSLSHHSLQRTCRFIFSILRPQIDQLVFLRPSISSRTFEPCAIRPSEPDPSSTPALRKPHLEIWKFGPFGTPKKHPRKTYLINLYYSISDLITHMQNPSTSH